MKFLNHAKKSIYHNVKNKKFPELHEKLEFKRFFHKSYQNNTLLISLKTELQHLTAKFLVTMFIYSRLVAMKKTCYATTVMKCFVTLVREISDTEIHFLEVVMNFGKIL